MATGKLPRKGTRCEINKYINKRTQKSQHTRDNWKRKEKKKQKNKAPDSQTSQATCQTKEINRAHCSHSTREAKQNKTNKKNQGSPIKTIKSHDSMFYPCTPTRPGSIYRHFCTGQAIVWSLFVENITVGYHFFGSAATSLSTI